MYTLWLTIWKHFISEKGQWLFPSFSLQTTKLYISCFTFRRKEENIQAHIYTVFLLRATTVHVFMLATITTQHRIGSSLWTLLDVMVWGFSLARALSLTSKSFLETIPKTHSRQSTAMQPHRGCTSCTPVHRQLAYQVDSSFNAEQRARKIHLEYSPSFCFLLSLNNLVTMHLWYKSIF